MLQLHAFLLCGQYFAIYHSSYKVVFASIKKSVFEVLFKRQLKYIIFTF